MDELLTLWVPGLPPFLQNFAILLLARRLS